MRRLVRELKPTTQERLSLHAVGDAYNAHVGTKWVLSGY